MTSPFTYSFPCSSSPKNWTVSFEIDKKIWLFENCDGPYKTACFDTTTKTWMHQSATNKHNHFGIRNKHRHVSSAVLNGKGYVWGQNELMEFDPVTQIWRNTGHMFRNPGFENNVRDIVQMGDCLYTCIVETGNRRLPYFLTLNMQTGERTAQDVNLAFNVPHIPSVMYVTYPIRLFAYNNTIYFNIQEDIFALSGPVGASFEAIPTVGGNYRRSMGFNSCATIGNLVYFYQRQDREEIIRVLNIDTFKWTSIHLENPQRHLPFHLYEILAVDEVLYMLWENDRQHGIAMIEPKPSLSTICLLTLANQFTEDPTIRRKLRPGYPVHAIDYQPYIEFKQQFPWPLIEKFDNLIQWRKEIR